MAHTERWFAASPDDVFKVLADGSRYADWVVGAKRIRGVDSRFPAPGAEFHHTVGAGPMSVSDSTEVKDVQTDRKLTLEAHVGPVGSARIDLRLRPKDGGTLVTMDETPTSGLGRILHNPLLDWLLARRNATSLDRLRDLVAAS